MAKYSLRSPLFPFVRFETERPTSATTSQAWPRVSLWQSLLLRRIWWIRAWRSREGGKYHHLMEQLFMHSCNPSHSFKMFVGDECECKSRTSSCWALKGRRWWRWNVFCMGNHHEDPKRSYKQQALVSKWCRSESLYCTCWQGGFSDISFSKWEARDVFLV